MRRIEQAPCEVSTKLDARTDAEVPTCLPRDCLVGGLPKTRSGKIMRRILRKVAEGNPDDVGDVTTLAEPQVVEAIIEGASDAH